MTRFRIDHAVVMDTDHIPGRGGYSLVGISRGVTQAERSFVAGNFGISDYLHDPKTETRIFYSSFRIPGGRRALVRRFARGVRRNQTQNRLYVHTLFLDDDVLQKLHGLPWLLVNASVRSEGANDWERLRDDVPWALDGTSLPPLEWDDGDGVTSDVVGRFNTRLTSIGNQLAPLPGGAASPADLVARVIGALSNNSRVVLPQGSAHELVTMLAWSMLPKRDREEIAWTQHDAANISGVVFQLANSAAAESELTKLNAPAAPFASWVVEVNTGSDEVWRDFHERSAQDHLTVREGSDVAAWQKWRDALKRLRGKLGAAEPDVASMSVLAKAAEGHPNAPWIDGHEVLDLLWPKVLDAIHRGQHVTLAAKAWGTSLYESGLGKVILRSAPDRKWLMHAAADVGSDAVVQFVLFAADADPEAKPARAAVAGWLVDVNPPDVDASTIARLAIRLAIDRSPALPVLLGRALATDAGLTAFRENLGVRRDVTDLVYAALPIVLERDHPGTVAFLRDTLIPRIDPSRPRIDADRARAVGGVLRIEPEAFLQFHARLAPDVAGTLMEAVANWMFHEPATTRSLARAVMLRIKADPKASETAGKLAIAMANAGEPAMFWFEVVLQMARATDGRGDGFATRSFLDTLDRLSARPLQLDGALGPLLLVLQSDPRAGQCMRALVMFARRAWGSRLVELVDALAAVVSQAVLASAWEDIVIAVVDDHGDSHEVSPLIGAFWLRVDPSQVPQLNAKSIEAVAHVRAGVRKQLVEHWSKETRLVQIPPSKNSDRLLALLFEERKNIRTSLDRRELEQNIASFATLNRLERSLHGSRDYSGEMAFALERFLGDDVTAVVRLVRLLELFRSDAVQPTVKLFATQRVLPHVLGALRKSEWKSFFARATDDDLLGRGVPALEIARRAGAVASPSTIEALERIYDERHRIDAAEALDAGWSTRGPLKSLARLFGSEEMRIADGSSVSM